MRLILLVLISLSAYSNTQDYPAYESLNNEDKIDYLWSLYLDQNLDPILLHQDTFVPKDLTISSQLRLKTMLNSFSAIKDAEEVTVKG
jgi:hypothetical protein